MRRIALLTLGLATLICAPASAGPLTDSCRSTDAALVLQGPCRGAEQVISAAEQQCRGAGACPRYSTDAHQRSWLHRALAFQYELAADVPMIDAPWIGTHNSANSAKQMPALSETDANQQLSLTDQLRLDVRSLEIDLHPNALGEPVACHGQGEGLGCTTERSAAAVFDEIAAWQDAHPDQVLLVYVEDHLPAAGEAEAMRLAGERLRVLPADRPFATLTRDAVRAAGARTILVGGTGSSPEWSASVFHWNPDEWEDRAHGFADCANAGSEAPPYATRLIRFYEDSTWLTQQAELVGASSTDDGLRPDTVRAMAACGVDLFGLDQVVPGDPRLDALVWSWAEGEEPSDCALLGDGGRWLASDCSGRRRAACRLADGSWIVTKPVRSGKARKACAGRDASFTAPRTAAQNVALAAATDRRVWVGI
jgi:hypothetical protein